MGSAGSALNRGPSAFLRRDPFHRRRQGLHAFGVASLGGRRVAIELGGEAGELRRVPLLGGVKRGLHRRGACGGERVIAVQLVEVRARERRTPPARRSSAGPARSASRSARVFAASISFCDRNSLGVELEDVEPARDLGAEDVAVVPVRRPGAADDQLRSRRSGRGRRTRSPSGARRRSSRTPTRRPGTTPCTMTSRPGIGISEPLCATQFS